MSLDRFAPRDCNQDRIIWLDLEMYSLEDHRVLECAVVLTTCNELKEVARKNWVIKSTQTEIDQHVIGGAAAGFHRANSFSNGLIEACLQSPTTQRIWQIELLDFLKSHCQYNPRLAGFSVHVDREVLRTQAPQVYSFLSHQIIDISTLDIIQWGLPPLESAARAYSGPVGNHRAMSDNEAAIAKLKWYQRWLREQITSHGDVTTSNAAEEA